jgi:hypothetical protein
MKTFSVLCIVLCVGVSTTAAFARGGMGGHGMGAHGMGMSPLSMTGMSTTGLRATGGAFGTSAAAPGTNSSGTALASDGAGHPMKGPLLGTDPAIDREDAKVEKMIGSICRGC